MDQVTTKNQPTQQELDSKLKAEAVNADFSTLISDPTTNKNKRVYIAGTIITILSQGVGAELIVKSNNNQEFIVFNLTLKKEFNNGDKIKAWGTFDSIEDNKPKIIATIIEKE